MAFTDSDTAMLGKKLVLSSDHVPEHLSEKDRFEFFVQHVLTPIGGACDLIEPPGQAGRAHYELVAFNEVGFLNASSNLRGWRRTRRHAASDTHDAFHIGFNMGEAPLELFQGVRDRKQAVGEVSFLTTTQAFEVQTAGDMNTFSLAIPGARLRERILNVEDRLLMPLDGNRPEMRHLLRYMKLVRESDDLDGSPALITHIESTLVDLAVLALKGQGDSAVLARTRGLRAARLAAIIADLQKSYTSQSLTPSDVATRQGISTRYLHALLQETGHSFSDRVQELRLQHACAMLASARSAHLKIIDIAMASGFSDVSYFNRCFRRRFGMSPTQARGASPHHERS